MLVDVGVRLVFLRSLLDTKAERGQSLVLVPSSTVRSLVYIVNASQEGPVEASVVLVRGYGGVG